MLKKLLCALISAAIMFCIVSCDSDSPTSDGNASDSSSSSVSQEEESSEPEEDDDKDISLATYKTMEEYIASDEVQQQLAPLKKSIEESGMKLSVSGEGHKLIYTYAFAKGMPTDGLKDSLASSLETQKATFESIAKMLKLAVDVDSPVVVVRYVSSDDKEIYSQEFEAK